MKSNGRMTSNGVEDGRTASWLRSGVHVMGAALGLLLASPTFAATGCRRHAWATCTWVPKFSQSAQFVVVP